MKNLRKRLACLLLSALLLIGCLPVTALGAENGFILVAEAGGKLVIAPEYVSCTAGQTAAQARSASGHTFTGLDTGMISAIDGVAEVHAPYEIEQGFRTIEQVLRVASVAIIVILLVVSLFIISNTIKLAMYDRKDEIAIMKMVGATDGFIRLPFFVEGFCLGLASAVIGFALQWGLYDLLAVRIAAADSLRLFTFVPYTSTLWVMIPAFLLAGLVVGIFGSLMSIRKFLDV